MPTYQGWINGNMTIFINTVRDYSKGKILDLDTTGFNTLNTISSPSSWTGCNAAFNADSWIPANSPNTSYSYIASKVTSANVGDTTTCTTGLANNGANTCAGSMDSTLLTNAQANAAGFKANLDTRYTSSCTFNAKM